MLPALALIALLAVPAPVTTAVEPDPQPAASAAPVESAEECKGTCVSDEDMAKFIVLLQERQCFDKQPPAITLDPISVIVDNQGRMYYSGSAPKPYKMRVQWCNYDIEAQGKVKVLAAVQEPPSYGFRFRPKAYTGLLLAETFRKGTKVSDALDAGLMVDPFYVKDFNLNFHVGFRSVGAGLGVDIFRSFGAYLGYAVAWDGFRSNPEASLWFAFW